MSSLDEYTDSESDKEEIFTPEDYLNNENITFYVNKNGNIDFFVAIYDSKINYNNTKTSDFLF